MTPTPGDVHVNTPLTNMSIAYLQNATNFAATQVFPNIPVAKQSDRYYTYDRGQFNRDEMQERAPSTESFGGGYTVDNTPTYYCHVYAFHKDIDDQMRANADAVLNPDREAMTYVTHKALIKREKVFVNTFFKTGVWGRELTGVASGAAGTNILQWNDPASTPIEGIRAEKTSMMENTGYEPNVLMLGQRVVDALLDHPDIIDRIKYGQTAGGPAKTTMQILASLFDVDKIVVSKAIENTAQEGQTNAHAFIAGKHALLLYAPAAPGLMTPSAGYTFSWTGYMGAGAEGNRIKQFRMENLASDRVEIEMCFAMKAVGTDLGTFWNGIVA